MSILLLDVFDRPRARDTLASRERTHYHIVTTFEAKESGAPGVLAQSLGICRRCPRGDERQGGNASKKYC